MSWFMEIRDGNGAVHLTAAAVTPAQAAEDLAALPFVLHNWAASEDPGLPRGPQHLAALAEAIGPAAVDVRDVHKAFDAGGHMVLSGPDLADWLRAARFGGWAAGHAPRQDPPAVVVTLGGQFGSFVGRISGYSAAAGPADDGAWPAHGVLAAAAVAARQRALPKLAQVAFTRKTETLVVPFRNTLVNLAWGVLREAR